MMVVLANITVIPANVTVMGRSGAQRGERTLSCVGIWRGSRSGMASAREAGRVNPLEVLTSRSAEPPAPQIQPRRQSDEFVLHPVSLVVRRTLPSSETGGKPIRRPCGSRVRTPADQGWVERA